MGGGIIFLQKWVASGACGPPDMSKVSSLMARDWRLKKIPQSRIRSKNKAGRVVHCPGQGNSPPSGSETLSLAHNEP